MTFDEQLDFFDESVRKLKIQYDLYFAGIRRVPPSFERGRLDSLMHELSRVKIREVGVRFRFNMLIAKYNQYRELWSRLAREREEGPLDFRRRLRELQHADEKIAERLHQAHPVTSPEPGSYVRVTGPDDAAGVAALHTQILEAHRALGRSALPTVEQVSMLIGKQSDALRSRYGVESIGFRVEIVDGKVKLKAKPLRE